MPLLLPLSVLLRPDLSGMDHPSCLEVLLLRIRKLNQLSLSHVNVHCVPTM